MKFGKVILGWQDDLAGKSLPCRLNYLSSFPRTHREKRELTLRCFPLASMCPVQNVCTIVVAQTQMVIKVV